MTRLVDPRAAARIKAAFDTCELVVRALRARRLGPGKAKAKPKAAPARTKMVYEGGTMRIVADND